MFLVFLLCRNPGFVVLAVVVMISDDGDQQIQMLLMTGKMIVEDDGIFLDFDEDIIRARSW